MNRLSILTLLALAGCGDIDWQDQDSGSSGAQGCYASGERCEWIEGSPGTPGKSLICDEAPPDCRQDEPGHYCCAPDVDPPDAGTGGASSSSTVASASSSSTGGAPISWDCPVVTNEPDEVCPGNMAWAMTIDGTWFCVVTPERPQFHSCGEADCPEPSFVAIIGLGWVCA